MEMAAELGQLAQRPHKFFRDDPRFQGAQADPLDSRNAVNPFYESQKLSVIPISALDRASLHMFHAIGAQVNARQNHFPAALGRQPFDFLFHIQGAAAPDPSSCIGDNAVAAELIASVLNPYECPSMFSPPFQPERFAGLFFSNIFQPCGMSARPSEFLQNIRQLPLAVVPDQDIHARIRSQLLGCHLHIAAHRDHQGLRIFLFGPVKHLP